jgi:hypothetical protein
MVVNFTGRLLDQLGVENDLAYFYTGSETTAIRTRDKVKPIAQNFFFC